MWLKVRLATAILHYGRDTPFLLESLLALDGCVTAPGGGNRERDQLLLQQPSTYHKIGICQMLKFFFALGTSKWLVKM